MKGTREKPPMMRRSHSVTQGVTIYEQTSRGERPHDIYSRLLVDRRH